MFAGNTHYRRRFRAGHPAVRQAEAFRAVFHHQERRRNGAGPLGLHEHREETPRIDSREEQHGSRAELDCILCVPAIPARIRERTPQPGSMKKDRVRNFLVPNREVPS